MLVQAHTLCLLKEKEEKGDEDEPPANIISKWQAGNTTAITVPTEDEELEELQQIPPDTITADTQEEQKSEGEGTVVVVKVF